MTTPAIFNDPRPWRDCTTGDIDKGDLVQARMGDRIVAEGIAHHTSTDGMTWCDEGDYLLTFSSRDATYRRIPAPPAPFFLNPRFGDQIKDVYSGRHTDYFDAMVFDGSQWCHQTESVWHLDIDKFTHPDGTVYVRPEHKDHANNEFVKEGS